MFNFAKLLLAPVQKKFNTYYPLTANANSPVANDEPIAQLVLNVPGSIKFSAQRYAQSSHWDFESKASIGYHDHLEQKEEQYLQLSFCVKGKTYCNQSDIKCVDCLEEILGCASEMHTVDVLQLQFSQQYLKQFLCAQASGSDLLSNITQQNANKSTEKSFQVTAKLKKAIDALLSHDYDGTMANIFVNAQLQMLLLYSLESHADKQEEPIFVCKFLANNDDRKKIMAARDVLLKNINTPITIKQLSKKVGINECYLKKGFKEIFGSTIFEFYQTQRMEHAKYLLYEKGLSVTEVADLLNYSSISHFSTAFKKQTGIKPCELLNR